MSSNGGSRDWSKAEEQPVDKVAEPSQLFDANLDDNDIDSNYQTPLTFSSQTTGTMNSIPIPPSNLDPTPQHQTYQPDLRKSDQQPLMSPLLTAATMDPTLANSQSSFLDLVESEMSPSLDNQAWGGDSVTDTLPNDIADYLANLHTDTTISSLIEPIQCDAQLQPPTSLMETDMFLDNPNFTSNPTSTRETQSDVQDPQSSFQLAHTSGNANGLQNMPSLEVENSSTVSSVDDEVSQSTDSQTTSEEEIGTADDHGNAVGGVKPKKYKKYGRKRHPCYKPDCEMVFDKASHLERHMATHSGEKNFFCEHCGRGFIRKDHLREHINIYMRDGTCRQLKNRGEKPEFTCQVDKCGLAFPTAKRLTAHFKMQHGYKPFVCTWPGCEQSFTQNCYLKRHLETHTAEKKFLCPICNKTFSRNDVLLRHIRKVHEKSEGAKSGNNCKDAKPGNSSKDA